MFLVLKMHTKDQHNDEMRFRFGMLMEGYEDEYFYWESVIASRKALVIMISVFMATLSVDIQAYVGIAVVMIYMSLHIMWKPYNHKLLDGMETLSLTTSFITLYAGTFLYIVKRNSRDAEDAQNAGGLSSVDRESVSIFGVFITFVIVFVNISYITYAIWEIIYQSLSRAKGPLKRMILCLHRCCRPCRSAEAKSLHALRHGRSQKVTKKGKKSSETRIGTAKVAPKAPTSKLVLDAPASAAETAEIEGIRQWKAASDGEDSA